MDKIWLQWLKAAHDDLLVIQKIIDEPNLSNVTAFHAQQAIEKSLKALLEYHKEDVPKIHSLNRLFKLVEQHIKPDNMEIINILDSLYIESRYPGSLGFLPDGKPGLNDVKEYYRFAKEIHEKVMRLVRR